MSNWTYIQGTIVVNVPGRTQAECDYILSTVLDHLPVVYGSERHMEIYTNKFIENCSSSCDEFDERTDNLIDRYGGKSRRGWLRMTNKYILTICAPLRDRDARDVVRDFTKWMCRLAKRLIVDNIFIRIRDYYNSYEIKDDKPFYDMHESPSWCEDSNGEPAWWEYLMWDRFGDWPIPLQHVVKYYKDDKADAAWEERIKEYDK